MKQIRCSIYYPHNKIHILVKYCLVNLLDCIYSEYEITAYHYFLSLYKGENITLVIYFKNDKIEFIKQTIEKVIHKFLQQYPPECIEETLPVNRLFLNIKPATLYFWKYNPFSEKDLFKNSNKNEARIISTLNRLCLTELSGLNKMDQEEINILYLRLLMIFRQLIEKVKSESFNEFLVTLFHRIQELVPESLQQINQIRCRAKNRSKDYFEWHREENTFSVPATDKWINLLKEASGISDTDVKGSSIVFLTDLFLQISQKFSLRLDWLIFASAVIEKFLEPAAGN